jgi:Cytochrome P460
MKKGGWISIALLFGLVLLLVAFGSKLQRRVDAAVTSSQATGTNKPVYTADKKLALPANYREWVFLSSGFGMNYSNSGGSHPMFTNVYVSPAAYQGFKSNGKWPNGSQFVVEIYSPAQGSINKSGYFQDEFKGLDVEVKDSSQEHEWSYYNFSPGEKTAEALGGGACSTCHSEHAAVEHTFVQFYPTLLRFAQEKHLLKPGVPIR